MKTLFKQCGHASLTWMIIFVVDYMRTLFSIEESGTTVTYMGLRIRTDMNASELVTTFSLTWRALALYVAFLAAWVAIWKLVDIARRRSLRETANR